MPNQVECHSDYTYAERPLALTWAGRRLEIAEILQERRTPEGKYFKVRTRDGQQFELTYSEITNEWQIHQP